MSIDPHHRSIVKYRRLNKIIIGTMGFKFLLSVILINGVLLLQFNGLCVCGRHQEEFGYSLKRRGSTLPPPSLVGDRGGRIPPSTGSNQFTSGQHHVFHFSNKRLVTRSPPPPPQASGHWDQPPQLKTQPGTS